jgi:hypothetical protein
VCGRPIIVTGGPVGGLTAQARTVRELGAERVFVLGSEGRGAGPVPNEDEAEWLALEVSGSSIIDVVRAGHRALLDLPGHARAAIDRFDPAHEALVVATFLNELPEIAGRPCLAFRRPEWVALEDKVVVDALWDRADVARAPSVVVPVERAALVGAARELDRGSGTVWAADARDGYHGGGEGLRWVRGDDDVDEAVAFLAARADQARVMPFLEGVPCGIHGLVFDDYVAALRPLEMVTLRREPAGEFFYAGVASYWDPAPPDREVMRDVARRVGALLRDEVAFRGAFTVDGVMTVDGFLPTELNPRSGAGHQAMAAALANLPLNILNAAISAGIALDFRPAELEALIVARADEQRGGGTWRAVPGRAAEVLDRAVVYEDAGYRWADEGEPPDGSVIAGPSTVGAFVRLSLAPTRTPRGSSVAPQATAFWRFADAHLGTGVGSLRHAIAVR